MAKETYRRGVTGVGEFHFPCLLQTEKFQGKDTGKFAVSFKPSVKEKQKLLAIIDEEWQKYTESEDGKKHKYKYDYSNGITTYKDEEYFKFKMQERIQTSRGEEWVRTVPIFDSLNREVSAQLSCVGTGTKGKIAYELVPFYMNEKTYGVSLRLMGVQILELKESYGATAESFGFTKEEDYTTFDAEDTPASGGEEVDF